MMSNHDIIASIHLEYSECLIFVIMVGLILVLLLVIAHICSARVAGVLVINSFWAITFSGFGKKLRIKGVSVQNHVSVDRWRVSLWRHGFHFWGSNSNPSNCWPRLYRWLLCIDVLYNCFKFCLQENNMFERKIAEELLPKCETRFCACVGPCPPSAVTKNIIRIIVLGIGR